MAFEEKQIEALLKLVNRGVQSGAEVLNQMLGAQIEVDVPKVEEIGIENLGSRIVTSDDTLLTVVEMAFNGAITGNSGLVFEEEKAWRFVEKVAGDDAGSGGFDIVSAGVLTEIGNIVLNRVLGSISNVFSSSLDFVVPQFFQGNIARLWQNAAFEPAIVSGLFAATEFRVSDMATNGSIVLFFEESSYRYLTEKIA